MGTSDPDGGFQGQHVDRVILDEAQDMPEPTGDPQRLKSLPPLTNEELDALLLAVQRMLREIEDQQQQARSAAIKRYTQERWTIYNSLRTAFAEARANGG